MKVVYLILAIVGFIAPNIYVFKESAETGNILLWLDPTATMSGMFANQISTAFIIDLLVVVLVFFIWSYKASKKHDINNIWAIWVLTMLFGMAGPWPLLLYMIEIKKERGVLHQ